MRFVELKKYQSFRDKLDIRITTYFSIVFAGMLGIVLLLAGEFVMGILTFILFGAALWVTIFSFRKIGNKSVERKRDKLELPGTVLDVVYLQEAGLLSLADGKVTYHSLAVGSQNKDIEIEIDEDLFMIYGVIDYKRMQKLKYGANEMCFVTVKEMPHGVLKQFLFFNVDNTLEKVGAEIERITKFNYEKHHLQK